MLTVPLGNPVELAAYFSYPNIPTSTESPGHTILHWVTQSLDRDGLTAQGVSARVETDSWTYRLYLTGSATVSNRLLQYTTVLPQFIANCALGIADMFNGIEANPSSWDPQKNGWRPMFPLGLPLIDQRSTQLFHYPPMNLLGPSRDYLDDAVSTRWAELLQANGMSGTSDIALMERLIDCAPIVAGDGQGTHISQVLTPIDYCGDYQLAQFAILLTASGANPAFTIPLIVCGGPPRAVFSSLFNVTLGVNQALRVNIVPGMTTPVLGANHPCCFYAQAQDFDTVFDGQMIAATCPKAQGILQ